MENIDTPNTTSPEDLHPLTSHTENTSLNPAASIESLRADSGFQQFDSRNVSAEKAAGAIFVGIVGIAAVVGAIALYFALGFGWIFFTALAVAIFLFGILCYFSIFWPAIEHRHRSWSLTEVGLEVRHGVWWKHMHAIPWARVQHADVSQGPLQRMYGVGTLTIHTAGTSNSSVNLGGLSHEVAIEIRDEIIRQRAAGDVV